MRIKFDLIFIFMAKNGETPLHLAARCGFVDTFDRLIEEGARPDMLNNAQENALHISVRECHFAIVRKVIEYVRSNNPQDGPEMVRQLINKQNKVESIVKLNCSNKD